MLDKDTIMELARFSGMRPWQQEKHYIQSLILQALGEEQVLFKGGTYLWFFHGLNRFSEDLDFTQDGELSKGLMERVSGVLADYGVENAPKLVSDEERTLSFRMAANGPLYSGPRSACYVYVEISRREKPMMQAQPLRLDLPQYKLPVRMLRGMDLQEIGAEKVRALATRQKARDIFDLWYLITKKSLVFNPEMVAGKLKYYDLEFDKKMVLDSVIGMERIFRAEIEPLLIGAAPPPTFSQCQKVIEEWMRA